MMTKLLQAAVLFSLLLSFGCKKMDTALLGGTYDSQTAIEQDLDQLSL